MTRKIKALAVIVAALAAGVYILHLIILGFGYLLLIYYSR